MLVCFQVPQWKAHKWHSSNQVQAWNVCAVAFAGQASKTKGKCREPLCPKTSPWTRGIVASWHHGFKWHFCSHDLLQTFVFQYSWFYRHELGPKKEAPNICSLAGKHPDSIFYFLWVLCPIGMPQRGNPVTDKLIDKQIFTLRTNWLEC